MNLRFNQSLTCYLYHMVMHDPANSRIAYHLREKQSRNGPASDDIYSRLETNLNGLSNFSLGRVEDFGLDTSPTSPIGGLREERPVEESPTNVEPAVEVPGDSELPPEKTEAPGDTDNSDTSPPGGPAGGDLPNIVIETETTTMPPIIIGPPPRPRPRPLPLPFPAIIIPPRPRPRPIPVPIGEIPIPGIEDDDMVEDTESIIEDTVPMADELPEIEVEGSDEVPTIETPKPDLPAPEFEDLLILPDDAEADESLSY